MINKAVAEGNLTRFSSKRKVRQRALAFVDNTLMFYNAKMAQLQHLKHIFLGYQACLKINLRNVRTSCGRGGEYWETCTCFQLQSWITSNNLPWSTVYLWKLLIRTVHFGIQWLRKLQKNIIGWKNKYLYKYAKEID